MAPPENQTDRRIYRREIRSVIQLLRWAGIALALIGGVGLALAGPGAWWLFPSWVSFFLGWALILAGVARRVRDRRN